MGQSDSGKCYIDGCENAAQEEIPKMFVDKICELCRVNKYEKTCWVHNNKPYNCQICPNTNVLKCNYYIRTDLQEYCLFHDVPEIKYRNKILKIRNDYVFIVFHRKGTKFTRFIHICNDIYRPHGSLSDEILYDLTGNHTLNELKKDIYLYFGILPRDIIGVIMSYL